jgi:hypothetical protein
MNMLNAAIAQINTSNAMLSRRNTQPLISCIARNSPHISLPDSRLPHHILLKPVPTGPRDTPCLFFIQPIFKCGSPRKKGEGRVPAEQGRVLLGGNRQLDEAVLMGSNEEFLAGRDTEFVEDAGQVMADRDYGDAQAFCNVLVGKAVSNQRDNLPLSVCQRTRPLRAR